MSFQLGLLVLCLVGLSLGEPPLAPYPAAGRPPGTGFTSGTGGSGHNQDLPELISARSSENNDLANHRIHFNLFKDHETKKTKDNISFKLGPGDGQFRNTGEPNLGRNFDSGLGNRFFGMDRNDLSQRYGSPQTNALIRTHDSTNFNQQNNGFSRRENDISTKYGTPNQFNERSSNFGSYDQSQTQHSQQDNQNNFRSSGIYSQQQGSSQYSHRQHSNQFSNDQGSLGFQPQSQYGNPQRFGSNPNTNSNGNRLSESYGAPQTLGQSRRFNQQQSSTRGSTRLQQGYQLSSAYGVPFQGNSGQNQFDQRDDQQQRSQFNSQGKFNPLQRQDGDFRYNTNGSSSDDLGHEKANYEFEYEVRGEQSHGHEESREGDETWGSYKVQLPDGRTMLVEYTADDRGYKPKITYSDQDSDHQIY